MRSQQGTHLEQLELRAKGNGTGVFAACRISPDEVILRMQGRLLEQPNRYSIQIDEGLHLGEGGLVDDEMNHACSPNAYIDFSDVRDLVIRAVRIIEQSDEVTINYCASEDSLVAPFTCACGSANCYGVVSGYRDLTEAQKMGLEIYLSPYLRKKYSHKAMGPGQAL